MTKTGYGCYVDSTDIYAEAGQLFLQEPFGGAEPLLREYWQDEYDKLGSLDRVMRYGERYADTSDGPWIGPWKLMADLINHRYFRDFPIFEYYRGFLFVESFIPNSAEERMLIPLKSEVEMILREAIPAIGNRPADKIKFGNIDICL